MSIRIDDWFVAGNAQKTNSDWNATSGFAQILNKPTNLLHTTGDESISGIKTFNTIPLSVTPSASSNDRSVATTEFVNSKISTHDNNISSHADLRQAITDTNSNIATSITTHNTSLTSHADLRQAITDTNSNISLSINNHNLNNLSHSDLRQAIADNTSAVSNISSSLSDETTARTADITNLQQQIDALSSKGDVTDIVGTYQDLLNYDTSTLLNKSIIKVLTDSTHDNASSYFKWNANTSAFDYIGSEAPTYTKTEIDTMDNGVVHKTGNETVGGVKTFSSIPIITGGCDTYEGGELWLASVNNNVNYNKGIIDIYSPTPADSTTHSLRIRMSGGANGLAVYNDGTATVVTPLSDSNDTHIATTEWVNMNLTNNTDLVHISGAETITGQKTFTSMPISKNGGMDITTTPSETKTNQIVFNDTNGVTTGIVMSRQDTSNKIYSYLYARAHATDTWNAIGVGYDASNNVFTYAPKPSATNSTSKTDIATTGWVNDPTTSTNVVHRTGDETIDGDKTFSNNVKSGKEFISTTLGTYGQFRAIQGSYGFFIRNDGNNTYFLLTDADNQYGTYNSLRPWYINNSTGAVTCNTTWSFSQTIQGTAYRAYWADLAEHYLVDKEYPKGTLVQFGGEKEITIAKNKVNAVITSEPGFILNGDMEGSQAIALIGRVPVRVVGKVKKFDKIALSYIDGVGCANNDSDDYIGIALVNKDDSDEGLVLCSIRINL